MKKLFTFFTAILFTGILFAQSPQKMSYQAVVRDASNKLVVNHQVGMQISIVQSSEDGKVVYTETQTPTTNANGLVSIKIGDGAGFTTIDWSAGPYFIKTETDPAGGTSYTITGVSQLMSVPYALHAKTAESVSGGQDISGIATNAIAITALQAEQIAQNAAIALNTAKKGITTEQATIISNTIGFNTGDQDVSGITTNATAISNEKARALTAEGANANAISGEEIRAKAAEVLNAAAIATNTTDITANATAISDEKIRAMAAEALNATAIATNTTNITTNATAISNEKIRAMAAEVLNASAIATNTTNITTNATAISTKVDKVTGKGLSTNDYTTAEQSKLAAITGTNTGDNAVNSNYSGLVSNATHTGDASGATALTVKGINGVALSGLTTGILKNTTGTGVPSIAVAGTDYSLVREFSNEYSATVGQTSFTLSNTPSASCQIKMYINGIRIAKAACTLSGTTATYVPGSNGSYVLVAGDRIQIDYYY